MHAVTFTAGQHSDFLLLVRAEEVKGSAVGARIHLAIAKLEKICALRNFFIYSLVRIKRAALVRIRELDRFPDLDLAAIRSLFACDHLEQRGLAHAVRADHTHDTTRLDLR